MKLPFAKTIHATIVLYGNIHDQKINGWIQTGARPEAAGQTSPHLTHKDWDSDRR
jgi:hypothetical protein